MDIIQFIIIVTQILIIASIIWVVLTQSDRLSRLKIKFGEHSEFEVELQQLVQKEVLRVNSIRLRELAKLDQSLIDVWEREQANLLTGSQSADFLNGISDSVSRLEVAWAAAGEAEKVDIALALREIYWLLLHRSRKFYASSAPYQKTKSHVQEMLVKFEKNEF